MKRTRSTAVAIIFAAVCILAIISPMTEASGDVVVLQHYHIYTPAATAMNITVDARYWVMGEVKNQGDAPVTNITVTANFYDASNSFINSTKTSIQPLVLGYPDANVLMPGQKAPLFKMWLDEKSGAKSVDHYNLTVSFSPSPPVPQMLQITVDKVVDYTYPANPSVGFSMYVNGTIKNIGSSTTENWYVYVTGYDSGGAMIGSDYDSSNHLAPGGVHSFSISVSNDHGMESTPTKNFASYAITAQSDVFNETTFRNVGQYTSVSDITGVVPEFPSVLLVLLFMTAMTTVLVLYKKRQP